MSDEFHNRLHRIDAAPLSSCLDDHLAIADWRYAADYTKPFMARGLDALTHSSAFTAKDSDDPRNIRLSGLTFSTAESRLALAVYVFRMHPQYVAKRLRLNKYEIATTRRCLTTNLFKEGARLIQQLKSGKPLATPAGVILRVVLRTLWIVVGDHWLSMQYYHSVEYTSSILEGMPDVFRCPGCGNRLRHSRKTIQRIREQRQHLKEYMDWCMKKYIDEKRLDLQIIQTLWLCSQGFNWVPSDNDFVPRTGGMTSSDEESKGGKSADMTDCALRDPDTTESKEAKHEEKERRSKYGAESGEQMQHESHHTGQCITM